MVRITAGVVTPQLFAVDINQQINQSINQSIYLPYKPTTGFITDSFQASSHICLDYHLNTL